MINGIEIKLERIWPNLCNAWERDEISGKDSLLAVFEVFTVKALCTFLLTGDYGAGSRAFERSVRGSSRSSVRATLFP